VDGKVLTQTTAKADFSSMPVGWAAEPAANRIVIQLPSRQSEFSEPIVEIEIDLDK